ncbi:MAG: hypothetical protein A4E66_02299 [Syntrophus sp. PtaB.Bin001]|nr:MAG: hypothetical protein A4E66_02299 [Syntrophus sp. PtaB.Bin001]
MAHEVFPGKFRDPQQGVVDFQDIALAVGDENPVVGRCDDVFQFLVQLFTILQFRFDFFRLSDVLQQDQAPISLMLIRPGDKLNCQCFLSTKQVFVMIMIGIHEIQNFSCLGDRLY